MSREDKGLIGPSEVRKKDERNANDGNLQLEDCFYVTSEILSPRSVVMVTAFIVVVSLLFILIMLGY